MPRNKKSDPIGNAADDLPDLTAQQLAFVEHILAGRSATDAYKLAYDTENMTQRTIWAAASKQRSHSGVSQWIAAARKAKLGSAVVTLADHTRELERIREIALETGNVGAAGLAEINRGKAHGLYTDRVEITAQSDPATTLREIAKHSPDLAEKLAAQHGLKLADIADHGTRH